MSELTKEEEVMHKDFAELMKHKFDKQYVDSSGNLPEQEIVALSEKHLRDFLFTRELELSRFVEGTKRAVEDEQEFAGEIVEEIWETIGGNKELVVDALRAAVRLTKRNILERIKKLTERK